jgi:Cu+-exporting ATPase
MIQDGEHLFCCKGCQGIFHLLKDEGLDSFYEKKGSVTLNSPQINTNDEYKKFDNKIFYDNYIKDLDGVSEINLVIEGIHCSACIWLNEKILNKKDGIIEASINYTNNKAKVIFDPNAIEVSSIFELIQSIGYKAYPYDKNRGEIKANQRRERYYSRLLVGVFATMNVMWLSIAQYAGFFTGIRQDIKDVLNYAEFILATPTLFFTGWIYFKGAYYGLKNRFINMDFLVASGATLAYLYSIYILFKGEGNTYFDSVTMIVTFIFIGKYLEVLSKKRAVDTMDSLASFVPTGAVVIENNKRVDKAVSEVQKGDIIEIKAGEKVVLDGVLIEGYGSFDSSSLTGESTPVSKKIGDEVLSGLISLDSVVRVKVSRLYKDSMINKIVTMLEDAMNKKPHIEKLANEISGYFSITILTIGIITFISWFYGGNGFETSLIVAISVIIIACPCALGLATPIATLVGINIAAKKKIIFKESSFLESMAKADILLLDKTGTITKGRPQVVQHKILKEFDISILHSLLFTQTHPISKGVKEFIYQDHIEELPIEDIKLIEAKGIKASYQNRELLAGNIELLKEYNIEFQYDTEFYNSILIFCIDSEVVAIYELEDEPKDEAFSAINSIKKSGLDVIMLTGDNKNSATKIANQVGIDKFYHSLTPIDKADFIQKCHNSGQKVIFAGDGINDSIALGLSDIAISMGNGAKMAIEVSDVVLLDSEIKTLKNAIEISQNTYKNIKQNLIISLSYNLITIPIAILGYVVPIIAAIVMSLSSLFVVANSLRRKISLT